ncbi:MAG: hypothetical protein JWP97_3252 [Labilithrix sp.]|nr:hypothetical protein [Labilithrix sp.]
MKRASLGWMVVTGLGLAALVGCAVGAEGEDVGQSDLTTLGADASDENSVVLQPPSDGDDAGSDEDASAPDSGVTVDGGKDGGTGTDAGPTSCAAANACAGATDLGSVSGDQGSDTKTFQGTGSQWFKVRVTENDNGVFGTKLEVRADLTSPAGTNFDLFVYRANDGTAVECSSVTTSSTSTGSGDSAATDWGEGTVSNGNSDDRTVTVEVRYVSGTCSPTSKWTLSVRGNP